MIDVPSVANLSDALGQLELKFQTMHSRIRPVFQGARLQGPAYTVQCYAGATYAVEQAIERAQTGDILVIAGEGYTGAVLMGGLLSGRANQRGVAGAIIDGAVRDTARLRDIQWPIFAVGVTPRAGTHDKLGSQQVIISCGDVTVRPGDIMVGDDDGIIVIPPNRWDQVVAQARAIEAEELFMEEAIERGLNLNEAVAGYRGRNGHA